MLESIKTYIKELPEVSFVEHYQNYICRVQDRNIELEVNSIKTDDILSLDKLVAKLCKELHS